MVVDVAAAVPAAAAVPDAAASPFADAASTFVLPHTRLCSLRHRLECVRLRHDHTACATVVSILSLAQ